MNANTHGNATKAIALIMVAVFMMCSFAVMFEGTDGAVEDERFTIPMRVNDSFSYEPSTNLTTGTSFSASTTYNGASNDVFGMDSAGKKLIGTPTVAGTYVTTLTATWTDGTLTQTARQIITFTVTDRIWFSDAGEYGNNTVTKGVLNTTEIGTEVYTVGFKNSPSDTVFDTASCTITYRTNSSEPSASNDLTVVFNSDSNVATVKVLSTLDEGVYTVTLPASYSSGATDSATCTLTLIVASDAVILTNAVKAYIGENDGSKSIPIQFTAPEGAEDLEFSISEPDEKGLVSVSGQNLVINTNGISASDIIGDSKDYPFKLRVTGYITPEGMTSEDRIQISNEVQVTLTMYKDLRFTSTPDFKTDVSAYPSAGNPCNVLIAATIYGATKITYSWGDGEVYERPVTSGDATTFFTAEHNYKTDGKYVIKVTAYNDFGDKSMFIMYNTESGSGTPGEDTGDVDKGFFEEHGWLFILFGVISVITLVAYFIFGVQSPAVILFAVLMAVLAVLMYVYTDFGGLIDALTGKGS